MSPSLAEDPDLEGLKAGVKHQYRLQMVALCERRDLTDEEFWVQNQDLALDALGTLARIKRRQRAGSWSKA